MRTGDELKDVEQWLADWFAARSKNGNEKMPQAAMLQTDYFAAGWLTSMEVVELVTEIEQEFAVQFSDGDFRDPRFVTIGGLGELILQRAAPVRESR
jgi:acyl carrier protein